MFAKLIIAAALVACASAGGHTGGNATVAAGHAAACATLEAQKAAFQPAPANTTAAAPNATEPPLMPPSSPSQPRKPGKPGKPPPPPPHPALPRSPPALPPWLPSSPPSCAKLSRSVPTAGRARPVDGMQLQSLNFFFSCP